jgi:4-hydroxybenzoyl-CoA thioesterase
MPDFIYTQKIMFQHCDPAGIVFYPRYFEMINATVEEWFADRIGIGFAQIHGERKAAVPTATIKTDFHAPSKLGDVLEFTLRPLHIGRSSLGLEIIATGAGQKRLSANAVLVFTRLGAGQSEPWPDDLRSKIDNEIKQWTGNDA